MWNESPVVTWSHNNGLENTRVSRDNRSVRWTLDHDRDPVSAPVAGSTGYGSNLQLCCPVRWQQSRRLAWSINNKLTATTSARSFAQRKRRSREEGQLSAVTRFYDILYYKWIPCNPQRFAPFCYPVTSASASLFLLHQNKRYVILPV